MLLLSSCLQNNMVHQCNDFFEKRDYSNKLYEKRETKVKTKIMPVQVKLTFLRFVLCICMLRWRDLPAY